MALYLTLQHLKYCLHRSKFGMETMFFIKKLPNQLFANHYFPINTTLEPIKRINFITYNFEIV